MANQTSVEAERKRRKATTRQKEAGKAIKRLQQKTRPLASKVFITRDGVRQECTTKEDIEDEERNSREFEPTRCFTDENSESLNQTGASQTKLQRV